MMWHSRNCPKRSHAVARPELLCAHEKPKSNSFPFVSLLIVWSAAAQNSDGPATEPPLPDEIVAARSQYTKTTEISSDATDGKLLAQLPHGRPPMMPRRGYYRGSYQNPWIGSGSAGHALIGAAIGFGFGATLGALGAINGHTPVGSGVLIGGSLLGFIGGAIGASHGGVPPSMHRRRIYSPWPDDDEEGSFRSPSKPPETQPEPSASRTAVLAAQSTVVEASAPA
jgi:hypothetical protein